MTEVQVRLEHLRYNRISDTQKYIVTCVQEHRHQSQCATCGELAEYLLSFTPPIGPRVTCVKCFRSDIGEFKADMVIALIEKRLHASV